MLYSLYFNPKVVISVEWIAYSFDNSLERSFNITKVDERFVSNILMTNTLKTVREVTQISCIDNYYLDKKQIQKMLDYEF